VTRGSRCAGHGQRDCDLNAQRERFSTGSRSLNALFDAAFESRDDERPQRELRDATALFETLPHPVTERRTALE
jgi:hypothetical protein